MIDLDTLRKAKGYVLAIVDESTGEYKPVSIDAVPVIRCKDCKYYKWEIDMCNLEGATVFPMNVVYEDDYCSRAERKDKNDSCQSV